MTTTAEIQFTRKMESGRLLTRDANTFEDLCKRKKDCFEEIPDGAIIKPYFDIDYNLKEDEPFDERMYNFLLLFALIKLNAYFSNKVNLNLEFAVAHAHKKSKYSFHINILNINTTKATLNAIIGEINACQRDVIDKELRGYIELGNDENVFDTSIYNANRRKIRCVYCVKDDEPGRPFELISVEKFKAFLENLPIGGIIDFALLREYLTDAVSGNFNDMLITAFVNPENHFHEVIPEERPSPTSSTTPKTSSGNNETKYDELLVNTAIEKGLLTSISKEGGNEWRLLSWELMNSFDDETAYALYDKFNKLDDRSSFTTKYDPIKNKELWDSWKTKQNSVEKPRGMGSFIARLKKIDKSTLAEIQKEIKQIKKEDMKLKEEQEKHKQKMYNEDIFTSMAKQFEKTHAKIINRSMYVKELPDKVILMSKKEMETSYEHMTIESESGGVYDEPDLFIKKWMIGNDYIRKYDDIDIYPKAEFCPKNIFNMWRPFRAELFTGKYTPNEEALKKILNHIRILCNHEEAAYQYFIYWIAQMIQYPEVKSINPVLVSKQGSGKGTLMKLCTKMMGDEKVLETTVPSRDVWGNFNGMMVNAFLVNLNELSKKETMESEGKIKGLQTDPTLIINSKGKNQFKSRSYHRFLTTTNSDDGGIKTTVDDRRNWIIRASDEKVGDKEYFTELHDLIEDDEVIRTCYDYFKSVRIKISEDKYESLDKFGQLPMPITEYQTELKKMSVSPIEMWLESFTRKYIDEEVKEMTGKDTYEKFSEWASSNNIKYSTTPVSLGVKLTNMSIEGVVKGRHTTRGDTKYFHIDTLKKRFNLGCLVKFD
jgi:hypothetical protein